jgi:hypothetical protein
VKLCILARVHRQSGFARAALLCGSLSISSACSKLDVGFDEPKRDPFEVQVTVVSDPGAPLPGASVLSGNRVVGTTGDAGTARLQVQGNEGDQVELTIKCPTNFESPNKPLLVSLRRFAPGSPPPQFGARCPPALRTLVVGVRAESGPNLPVMVLGRPVARTDSSGAALFSIQARPSEQVEVTVNTAEPGAEQLRPQSPTLTFVAKETDDFVVLEVNFTVAKKRVVEVPVNRPQRIPAPM